MSKRRVIVTACIFFIFGVFIASIFFDNFEVFYFFILFVLSLVTSFYYYPKKIFIPLLWGAFLFFGVFRVLISIPENTPDKIWFYNDSEVSFVGEIVKEPDVRASNQKLTIDVIAVDNVNISGNVLVTVSVYPEYEYGDILEIKCKLKAPKKFEDFAYDKYLARYGIYSVCGFGVVRKLDGEDSLYKYIYRIKNKISEIINIGLPEPQASLANAMTLGYKRGVDDSLRDAFSRVGLSHIMAISGMHISIIVAVLFNFLLNLGLKRKYIFYGISLFLIFYVVLIGAPASAVRASLMGFLVLLAMHVGRLNRLSYTLVLVASLLLLINPKQLMSDIGFQLSFLAVFGIVYFYPILNGLYDKFKDDYGSKWLKVVYDIVAVTLSAQVFTLPIIIYNFRIISFVSPLSNLLVLWLLPFILISIFVAIPLSMMFPSLSVLFFLPASIFLKYIIFISEFLASISFAYFIF